MPTEYRLIQFKGREIEEAVDRWLRANGEMGQYSRMNFLVFDEKDKHIRLIVECWDMQGRTRVNTRNRTLSHEEIGQAIVLYCKDNGIPLARQGRKVFRLMDEKIAMYYQLP